MKIDVEIARKHHAGIRGSMKVVQTTDPEVFKQGFLAAMQVMEEGWDESHLVADSVEAEQIRGMLTKDGVSLEADKQNVEL